MSSKLLTAIEHAISRRSFLRTTMQAATALIGGVLLGPRAYSSGNTFHEECCTLCKDPATCSFTDCLCTWGWLCCHTPQSGGCILNNTLWRCQECITTLLGSCTIPCSPNGACGQKAQCPGVKCSSVSVKAQHKCPGEVC
jgi:hypothetical protein